MPTEEPNSEPKPQQIAQTLDFVEFHRPALERDEVAHNVILASLDRLAIGQEPKLRWWTLGAPGACAVQSSGYPIVLGDLTQAQCRALANETRDLDYPGVVGPEETAQRFAERAIELGLTFVTPIPQQRRPAGLHGRHRAPDAPCRRDRWRLYAACAARTRLCWVGHCGRGRTHFRGR